MATTSAGTSSGGNAVVYPQAKGTGLPAEDDNIDAAGEALLAEYTQDDNKKYVGHGMQFTNHDAANDVVDVSPGYCFLIDDSGSTSNDRGSTGNAQIQSTAASGYDTELPEGQVYVVVFETAVTISCTGGSLNEIWVNITDVTSNNAVEVRSSGGGGTTAAPSNTYIKLGEADPDDATRDTLVNRNPSPTFDTVTANSVTDSAIDHNNTTNYVANEHIDHSTVSVTAGTYLTGGGDITTSQTLNFDEIQWKIDNPESFGPEVLDDTEANTETVRVEDGETLTIYAWGAFRLSDYTAPAGLTARVLRGDNTTVGTPANTVWNSNTNGIVSDTNSTGSASLYKLQAYNGTGSTISNPGVDAHFAWEVA